MAARSNFGDRRDAVSPAVTEGVFVSVQELVRLGPASQGLSFRARQPARSILRGRMASRLRGPGLDFEELRAYQPGDDIRAMDWRVSARTRTPFVRVYREEKERPVLVVVDQRASMFFGSVHAMKSVTAARAAAVVAHRVVAAGDRVGAVVFGDRTSEAFSPQRSKRQVMRIVRSVCDHNQSLGQPDARSADLAGLDRALEQVLRLSTHDHLVILISDLTGAGETTRQLATRLRRKNDLMLLWTFDPLESQLPNVGQAVLGDNEMQVQIDTSSDEVRRRFAQDVEQRRERASSFALRYDVPLLPLSTNRDVVVQLGELLSLARPARRV